MYFLSVRTYTIFVCITVHQWPTAYDTSIMEFFILFSFDDSHVESPANNLVVGNIKGIQQDSSMKNKPIIDHQLHHTYAVSSPTRTDVKIPASIIEEELELFPGNNDRNPTILQQQPSDDYSAVGQETSALLDEVIGINKGRTIFLPVQRQDSTNSQGQETGPSNASSGAVISSKATTASRQSQLSLPKKSRSSSVSTGM